MFLAVPADLEEGITVSRDTAVALGMVSAREGSLGYGIIRSLVRRIEGTIDTRSKGGLTMAIHFPI